MRRPIGPHVAFAFVENQNLKCPECVPGVRVCTRSLEACTCRDELVLEAHLDADEPHIVLRREGEPGSVAVHLNEACYLISALGSMAAEMAGVIVGDPDDDTE